MRLAAGIYSTATNGEKFTTATSHVAAWMRRTARRSFDIKPVMREFLPREAVRQPSWATELMEVTGHRPEQDYHGDERSGSSVGRIAFNPGRLDLPC